MNLKYLLLIITTVSFVLSLLNVSLFSIIVFSLSLYVLNYYIRRARYDNKSKKPFFRKSK